MKNKILKVFFIIFCGLISLVLFGCKKESSIKFYRESAVNEALNKIKALNEQNSDSVKKSSGMIIYKDNSSARSNNNLDNTNFGPKDLNFDLPGKF